METFEKIQTEYVQKIAQDAVDKGNLGAWALLEVFNLPVMTIITFGFTFLSRCRSVVDKFNWWANSEEVLGIKPDILYGDINVTSRQKVFLQNGDGNTKFSTRQMGYSKLW